MAVAALMIHRIAFCGLANEQENSYEHV